VPDNLLNLTMKYELTENFSKPEGLESFNLMSEIVNTHIKELIKKRENQILERPDLSEFRKVKIPITVNDSTYEIEVQLFLVSKGGNLAAYITSLPKAIEYITSTTNNTNITAPPKQSIWKYLLAGFVLGVILMGFVRR